MHNNTTNFVIPVLFQDKTFKQLLREGINPFQYMLLNGFQNAYLNDYNYMRENCIFLLFENKITDQFIKFSKLLEQHEEYLDSYEVDEGKIMFVFTIPREYIDDVRLIKMGKYSLVSQKYKKLFPEKVKDKNGKEDFYIQWMILHKHPQWRKKMEEDYDTIISLNAELWDAFKDKDEIFNYNKELNDSETVYKKQI